MVCQVKCLFKKAVINGGAVSYQLEALTDEPQAFDAAKLAGEKVIVEMYPEQPRLDLETGEVSR